MGHLDGFLGLSITLERGKTRTVLQKWLTAILFFSLHTACERIFFYCDHKFLKVEYAEVPKQKPTGQKNVIPFFPRCKLVPILLTLLTFIMSFLCVG